jgi:hypothetical protein
MEKTTAEQKMNEIHALWEREIKAMRCGLPNKTMSAIPADFVNKVMNAPKKSSTNTETDFSGMCD